MDPDLLSNVGFLTIAALSAGLYLFLLGCNAALPPKKLRGKIWLFFIAFPILVSAGSNVFLKTNQISPAEFFVSQLRLSFAPPMPLNEHMRLENITAEKNNVVFHVSISPHVDRPRKHMDDLKNELSADACSKEDFMAGLKSGVNLEIRFTQLGQENVSLVISPSDCAPRQQ